MKQLWLFLIGMSLICSCRLEKKNQENEVEITEKDSIFFLKGIDTSKALKLDLDDALEIYGQTTTGYFGKKDNEYTLGDSTVNFDVMLHTVYTNEQIKSGKIIIKEMTWELDSMYKITIWYEKKDNNRYIPKSYHIWEVSPNQRFQLPIQSENKYLENNVKEISADTLIPYTAFDLSKALKLSLCEAVKCYGETVEGSNGVKDYEYILRGTNGINDRLHTIYTEDQMQSGKIVIKEATWAMDSIYRLTIWYEKTDSNQYIPKDYHIWPVNFEF